MTPLLTPVAAITCLLGMLHPILTPSLVAGVLTVGPSPVDQDADRDGVPDAADACPGTPDGYPVDSAGCALDSDHDGVADGADRCPVTSPGARGIDEVVDAQGCSMRDRKKERDFRYSLGVG